MSGPWTAIVLAGQRPGENDFAQANGTRWKALIPVGGEAMLGRVVRVLLEAAPIGRIVILAQDPPSLVTIFRAVLLSRDPTAHTGSGGHDERPMDGDRAGRPAARRE
jgi:hypothetical protein